MPQATYIQDGDSIDYTPGSDVAAGDVVVLGSLIGIAKRPIAANTLGSLAVTGVFEVPKMTGGSGAIAAGATVYWNNNVKLATGVYTGSEKVLGKAIKAETDAAPTVRVLLRELPAP